MTALSTIHGDGWSAHPRDEQYVLRFYDLAGKRRYHRLPTKVLEECDVRRYVRLLFKRLQLKGSKPPHAGRLPLLAGAKIRPDVTFEELARLWTTGELHQLFPRHVRAKKSAGTDESRLKKYVYPIIGDIFIVDFEPPKGLEHAERVMSALPPPDKLSDGSARHVGQVIRKVLQYAVYPAKLLSTQPIPKGFMPSQSTEKAKSYLYPTEDTKLMAFMEAPLVCRLLFGFLDREGPRPGEARLIQLRDLDLGPGKIHLDKTKTNVPRDWALQPGTTEALRRWRDRHMTSTSPDAYVFGGEDGQPLDKFELAEELRTYLKKAGVTRPQLFTKNANRLWLRAHDLRASFVTINLANGKSESWVADRTGHLSSQMINRYKRWARSHAELDLGEFKPLVEAIPELRVVDDGEADE